MPEEREEKDGFEPVEDIVTECLADDDRVWCLAHDIVSGELELDLPHLFITDKLEYDETCADIRESIGVTQPQVEQAIELAKERLQNYPHV